MGHKFSSSLGLAVVFGCMVLAEAALAQQIGTFAINNGEGTPKAGDIVETYIISTPAGTKLRMIKFSIGSKIYVVGQSSKATNAEVANYPIVKGTINKVVNPLPMRLYDGITVSDGPANTKSFVVEVVQGNAKKKLGAMTIHMK